MDANKHQIVAGKYDVREKTKDLVSYFTSLKQLGLNPKSVTIDGKPGVMDAFLAVWPKIVIQRCLVHIQRQGLMWCRLKPKRTDGKHLRQIFLSVTQITTRQKAEKFLLSFQAWERRYGKMLTPAYASGWVISDLVRARSMLLHALPDMFHFLIHPQIPSTTNGLEGYFSRLKEKYQKHRGLSKNRRAQYFQWYINLVKH